TLAVSRPGRCRVESRRHHRRHAPRPPRRHVHAQGQGAECRALDLRRHDRPQHPGARRRRQRPGRTEPAVPALRPGSEVPMTKTLVLLLALAATGPRAQTVCTPIQTPPGTILRDARGVPHIFASSLDDLIFTNGYVEAQDRLFEMEIFRRAGRGTLSAVLGASFLEMDEAT